MHESSGDFLWYIHALVASLVSCKHARVFLSALPKRHLEAWLGATRKNAHGPRQAAMSGHFDLYGLCFLPVHVCW